MADTKKKVLYIGGHGKVGLLAAPKLAEAGHEVHSLIRNPDQKADIEQANADSSIPHIILKPAGLTEEPAQGLEFVEDKMLQEGQTSSRDLVADVIVEVLGREELPTSPVVFVDGDKPVSSIK